MKIGVLVLGSVGLLSVPGLAAAAGAPPARVGFQMDIRTGYSMPMGKVYSGLGTGRSLELSDAASGQVPLIVDIGGKVIPQLFLGGYFGLGFGGAGGAEKTRCDAADASCIGVSAHLGIEAQYHILPAGFANPWLGYGLGFESFALSEDRNGVTRTSTVSGFEFARLMAGVDFRVNRVFGVGPFIDFSMSQYSSLKTDSVTRDIDNTATHEWLTLGARFVFFP